MNNIPNIAYLMFACSVCVTDVAVIWWLQVCILLSYCQQEPAQLS